MDLYFVRHGIAIEPETWSGAEEKRPLTDDGKKRIAQEAERLAAIGLRPDRIVASPLVRARQTAEILADALGLREKVVDDELLAPGFGIAGLRQILGAHQRAASLMLVGHEPDFSTLVGRIIGGGRVECKKGGVARVRIDDANKPSGTLLWLLPPKLLE